MCDRTNKKAIIGSSFGRNAAVALFLTLMATVAGISGQREVVFPEAGALCIGLWLMPKAVWNVRSWQIPTLLTAAAIIGLAINLLLPVRFEVRFIMAFILVMGLLRLLRCNMYPVVSAAMLPVLIGTSSWLYPLSVLAISMLLTLGRRWLPQAERPEYHPFGWQQMLKLTIALCIPLLVMLAFPIPTLHYLAVPPLVVTMIEFSNRKSGFRKRPWTIWILLVAASTIGTAAELGLHRILGIPIAVSTLLATTLMLLLFRRFKPFAPSLAIVLVPLLLPEETLPWFPLLAALGSAWFIAMGMLNIDRAGVKGFPSDFHSLL